MAYSNIEVTDVDVRERDGQGRLMVLVPIADIRRVTITTGFLAERPIVQIILAAAVLALVVRYGPARSSMLFLGAMCVVGMVVSLRRGRYLRIETANNGIRKLRFIQNTDEKMLREQLINAGVTFTETGSA